MFQRTLCILPNQNKNNLCIKDKIIQGDQFTMPTIDIWGTTQGLLNEQRILEECFSERNKKILISGS